MHIYQTVRTKPRAAIGDRATKLEVNRPRYYDATVARWLNEDPLGYRPDVNLYRYVKNNPVNAKDPNGSDEVQTDVSGDEAYQRGTGLQKGIDSGTLTKDTSLWGQTYRARRCLGMADCVVEFKFEQAWSGTYPYDGTTAKGVYVKIVARFDEKKCCKCGNVRVIQVLRDFELFEGEPNTLQPSEPDRRKRSGSDSKSAPSRGWRVDPIPDSNSPYYDEVYPNALAGSSTSPVVFRDSPGLLRDKRNKGKEFYTCLICSNAGEKGRVIACLHWGFLVSKFGEIGSYPVVPQARCGFPQQFRDAVERWNTLGKDQAELDFG
jgi:RHS repeat-associated protein